MRRIVPILVALGLLAGGCSGIKVDADYDPNADFQSLSGYAWLPPTERQNTGDPRVDNPLLASRVESAVDNELVFKGFRKVEDAEADFFVNFHVGVQSKVDVTSVPTTYGYGRWGGVYATETRVDQYEQGTLLIDIIDREKDDLIWRGSGQSRVHEGGTPEERNERVRKAVAAILADFPPK